MNEIYSKLVICTVIAIMVYEQCDYSMVSLWNAVIALWSIKYSKDWRFTSLTVWLSIIAA